MWTRCVRATGVRGGGRAWPCARDRPVADDGGNEGLRLDNISNAEVRVGDAEHIELADESFDVVMCGFGVFLFSRARGCSDGVPTCAPPGWSLRRVDLFHGVLDYPWLAEVVEEMSMGSELESQLRGAAAAMRRPLLDAEGVSQILWETRFEGVAVTTSERRFVFADVDAYLLWVRSHVVGVVLRRLSERDWERFRRGCVQRLEDHQATDGYELIKRADFTVAHRA